MKKVFFFLILLYAYCSSAQKIRFTDSSNVWYYLERSYNAGRPTDNSNHIEMSYGQDSLVGITLYKTMYQRFGGQSQKGFRCFIREDTIERKVYLKNNDTAREVLLYNFNVGVGDTVYADLDNALNGQRPRIVTRIDSILIDSFYYRNITVEDHFGYVEGIGTSAGPLHILHLCFENSRALTCFKNKGIYPPFTMREGKCASEYDFDNGFHNDSLCTNPYLGVNDIANGTLKSTIIPNPCSYNGVIEFSSEIAKGELQVYDILGRLISRLDIIHKKYMLIGSYISAPGMYYYKLVDRGRNIYLQGKFSYL